MTESIEARGEAAGIVGDGADGLAGADGAEPPSAPPQAPHFGGVVASQATSQASARATRLDMGEPPPPLWLAKLFMKSCMPWTIEVEKPA